jgi:hypothetical protein
MFLIAPTTSVTGVVRGNTCTLTSESGGQRPGACEEREKGKTRTARPTRDSRREPPGQDVEVDVPAVTTARYTLSEVLTFPERLG